MYVYSSDMGIYVQQIDTYIYINWHFTCMINMSYLSFMSYVGVSLLDVSSFLSLSTIIGIIINVPRSGQLFQPFPNITYEEFFWVPVLKSCVVFEQKHVGVFGISRRNFFEHTEHGMNLKHNFRFEEKNNRVKHKEYDKNQILNQNLGSELGTWIQTCNQNLHSYLKPNLRLK